MISGFFHQIFKKRWKNHFYFRKTITFPPRTQLFTNFTNNLLFYGIVETRENGRILKLTLKNMLVFIFTEPWFYWRSFSLKTNKKEGSFFTKTEQKFNEMGYEWMMNKRNGLLMNDERTKWATKEWLTNEMGY